MFDSLPRSGSGSWISVPVARGTLWHFSQPRGCWVSVPVARGTLWQVSQHRCRPIKLGCASISDCHSGLIYCARLIWLQELVIIYTCQRTCTQAKLVRGLDPHGFNALPPKDLILLMSSNGYPAF